MKAVRITLCGIAVSVLAGCASTSEYVDESRHVQDDQYVSAVEEIAKRRGVRVHWVNPPDRRIVVASND
jgi:hypothetical protein